MCKLLLLLLTAHIEAVIIRLRLKFHIKLFTLLLSVERINSCMWTAEMGLTKGHQQLQARGRLQWSSHSVLYLQTSNYLDFFLHQRFSLFCCFFLYLHSLSTRHSFASGKPISCHLNIVHHTSGQTRKINNDCRPAGGLAPALTQL